MLREAMAASRGSGQGLQPFVQPPQSFERAQREAVQGLSGAERLRALGIPPQAAAAGQRLSDGDTGQPAQAQEQAQGQRLSDDDRQPAAQAEEQAQGSRAGSRSCAAGSEEAPAPQVPQAAQAEAQGDEPSAEDSAGDNQRSGQASASDAAGSTGAAPDAPPGAAGEDAAGGTVESEPPKQVDLQLRLPNGQKVRQQFCETDRVGTVYAFVDNRCPDLAGVSYSLTTVHPRRVLEDYEQRLCDAGVSKQCVMHVEKR